MNHFEFQTVPHIISQTGAANHVGQTIALHYPATRHVLLVTDAGFLKTGLMQAAIDNIRAQQIEVSVFSDVVADPPEAIVLAAASQAHILGIDLVVGFGGGSSMDVAKLIAILAGNEQELSSMYGIGNIKGQRLPLIQIPTTAGTGSEATPIAVVTTGETSKMGVVAPQLYADIAILDAQLTLGLPVAVSAATGIDAMVHAIEAFTTKHKKNPLSDMLAKQALQLLWSNIRTVCREPQNLAARQAMLLGAFLAGQSFANAPCAAVHALAYPIGGIFHVPHGLSNSLVLPAVLRFNASAAHPHYAELAAIVAPHEQGSSEAKSSALINALEQLTCELGIATRLQQVGIKEGDLDKITTDAMLQTRLLGNNPREVTWQQARAIYAEVL
ncbi:iron-containing alcohol dehydrogenase [Undibacterium jejuense]|uniref:Iron-containing alcohol dehydrogenase n=1 Tax=Undibacterium jejuense TaxID=1344949 RepID=A0A923HNW6_9BURK|nr:iron-containing alcohol dehydrogenase [Undibacterium jejuense]MBC3862073.1 iron-containing alcohol dehydrogenase [Undibacterium jejuense]